MCRLWRHTFLQHAPLWSQLYLARKTDQDLLATLLERVKRSPLYITLEYSEIPVPGVALLSPFSQQIKDLILSDASQEDIQELSAALSGPLPLLRTLNIEDNGHDEDYTSPLTPTSLLFEGAVDVKEFVLHVYDASSLSHFLFPNLTTFVFWTCRELEVFPLSLLLNFLEASPSLQDIEMLIAGDVSYRDVPRDKVLVLPRVKDFLLNFTGYGSSWELATYLSCPSADHVGFGCNLLWANHDHNFPEDIYPPWNAIVRHYTKEIVDQVELQLQVDGELAGSIAFRSPGEACLALRYSHPIRESGARERIGSDIFSRASRTIRDHPRLKNVRHLFIRGGNLLSGNLELAANDVGKLLGSMGPLEDLDIRDCDLRPYLDPFLETPLFPNAIQPTSFPPIRALTIDNPVQSLSDDEGYATAVVKLAKSQHARGMPFELVILPPQVPSWVIEELLLSADAAECSEMSPDEDQDQD